MSSSKPRRGGATAPLTTVDYGKYASGMQQYRADGFVKIMSLENGSSSSIPRKDPSTQGMSVRTGVTAYTLTPLVPLKTSTGEAICMVAELSHLRIVRGGIDSIYSGLLGFLAILYPELVEAQDFTTCLKNYSLGSDPIHVGVPSDAFKSIVGANVQDTEKLHLAYGVTRRTTAPHPKVVLRRLRTTESRLGECTDVRHAYAMAGVYLAMMGKIVGIANGNTWFGRRWTAFCGAIAAAVDEGGYLSSIRPDYTIMVEIGKLFSSAQGMRRMIMEALLGGSREESSISTITSNILRYLRWAEMGHIGLINKYIFSYHPQLIFLAELRPYIDDYLRAIDRLSKMDEDSRMWCYAKLLDKKDNLDYLHRTKFMLLTSIAFDIGKDYSPSLSQYQGGYGELTSELAKIRDKALILAWNSTEIGLPESMSTASVTKIMETFKKAEIEDETAEVVLESATT